MNEDPASPAVPETEPAPPAEADRAAAADPAGAPEAAVADAASAPEAPAPEAPAEEPSEAASAEAAPPAAPAPDPAAIWKDRCARLQADFDNYRKRQAREREDWIRQSNADLLEELLPVLDQTDAAIAAAAKDASEAAKPFLDGFEVVRRTFLNAVAKFGLKPVEGTVGKPLDTATSEALTVMRTGQADPGSVVFETRKGYTLNGKLLRAAQVVVEDEAEAASPDAAAPAAAGEEG